MQVINYGILILIFCTSKICAIRCYQCTHALGIFGTSCQTPTADLLRPCPAGQRYCYTRITGTSFAKVITRRCTDTLTSDKNGSCNGIKDLAEDCQYTCSTSGCNTHGNGSKVVTASFSTILIGISIFLVSFML